MSQRDASRLQRSQPCKHHPIRTGAGYSISIMGSWKPYLFFFLSALPHAGPESFPSSYRGIKTGSDLIPAILHVQDHVFRRLGFPAKKSHSFRQSDSFNKSFRLIHARLLAPVPYCVNKESRMELSAAGTLLDGFPVALVLFVLVVLHRRVGLCVDLVLDRDIQDSLTGHRSVTGMLLHVQSFHSRLRPAAK